MGTDNRKQSIYLPREMLAEIVREAKRLDRSLSWVVQAAWRAGRREIAALPDAPDLGSEP